MSSEQKVLGNLQEGLMFIVSAPAGAGKTTLVEMLKREFSCIKTTISYTTRTKRPQEQDGVDYYFISEPEFEKKSKNGDFVEEVSLFGHRYGTSLQEIKRLQAQGIHVVLVIDTQGAKQLLGKIPLITIFIAPPSIEELKRRLHSRGTEDSNEFATRLRVAEQELSLQKMYDYLIVNDNLYVAYQVFRSIFIAEEHKVQK